MRVRRPSPVSWLSAILIVLISALAVAAPGSAQPPDPRPATGDRILSSVLPGLADPSPLDGATLRGGAAVFLATDDPTSVTAVNWWIGDQLANRDAIAPFVFGGEDDELVLWDTTLLPDGLHTIAADVLRPGSQSRLVATVSVRNNQAPRSDGLVASLDDGAEGVASLTVVRGAETNLLCFRVKVETSERPKASHVQFGEAGIDGPVFIDLRIPAHPYSFARGSWLSEGCVRLSEDSTATLLEDPPGHYVNVTTPSQPTGAVRGQLLAIPPTMLAIPLLGPAGDPDGKATLGIAGDIVCHSLVVQGARPRLAVLSVGPGVAGSRLPLDMGTLGTDGRGSWSSSGCERGPIDELALVVQSPGEAALEVTVSVGGPAGAQTQRRLVGGAEIASTRVAVADEFVAAFDLLANAICFRLAAGNIGPVRFINLIPSAGGAGWELLAAPGPPTAEGSGFSLVRGCRGIDDGPRADAQLSVEVVAERLTAVATLQPIG